MHMPGTLFEDKFASTTTEEALEALGACAPAIEVVGIIDYFTTASFRRAQEAWVAGAGSKISYLFPNVELRLDNATARGSGVNLHVLAAAENVDLLDDLLSRLMFSFRDVDYPATDAGLISLGRAFSGDAGLAEAAARKEGAQQFKAAFADLRALFQRDARLRGGCLIAVAAGADGSSGLTAKDGSFVAYRQGLERFAHLIFSGNPKDRAFWLGQGSHSIAAIEADYHSQKACLHGSDAHEVARLGKPDLDRYTWLKGDAQFDTLWQTCLAPERRVHIGPNDPASGQHGRITGVTINDGPWFSPGCVRVNTGLVAIIGARGSGKTALADLIAVGAGSPQPFENDAAFVRRAGALLAGSSATVSWYDDDDTTRSLSQFERQTAAPRRVRYLSQQFVERLCASDGVRPELLHEIERVIFEAWPVERRQGATSFQDLLGIRLASARAAQADERRAVTEISEAITGQRVLKSRLSTKEGERTGSKKTIATLEQQIRELTGKADAASGHRHGVVSAVLAARQRELQVVDRRLTELKGLQAAVRAATTTSFPAFLQRLREPREFAGLTDEQWQAFRNCSGPLGYGLAPTGAGIQGWPLKRSRRTVMALWPFLRAVPR